MNGFVLKETGSIIVQLVGFRLIAEQELLLENIGTEGDQTDLKIHSAGNEARHGLHGREVLECQCSLGLHLSEGNAVKHLLGGLLAGKAEAVKTSALDQCQQSYVTKVRVLLIEVGQRVVRTIGHHLLCRFIPNAHHAFQTEDNAVIGRVRFEPKGGGGDLRECYLHALMLHIADGFGDLAVVGRAVIVVAFIGPSVDGKNSSLPVNVRVEMVQVHFL